MWDHVRRLFRRWLRKHQMQKKSQTRSARRHHVIPQLYLAGFTDSGEKDGLLYAHDLRELKTWRAKPANIAFVKDFYKIDVPGIDTDEIERVFCELEGAAARVLKKIIRTSKLPWRRKHYNVLMHFMAQLVVRRPSVRESVTKSIDQVLRMVAGMYAGLPEADLQRHLDRLRGDNPDLFGTTLREFREFIKSDDYTTEFSQNFHINNLLSALLPTADDTIAPLLAARHWVLWIAQEGAGHFITTDRPVLLTWTIEVPPFYADSPGFGLQNTLVLFPISKRLALYGRFEGPRRVALPADADQVALINRMMSYGVVRFIYSTDENFAWKKLVDDRIGDTRDLFDAIKDHQAKKAATAKPKIEGDVPAMAEVAEIIST